MEEPVYMAKYKKGNSMNDLVERFLRYVKIDTQSDENTNTHPSSEKQHNLAKVLVEDLKSLGVANVTYDKEHCYVYAKIPSSEGVLAPALGFIAHMDTSSAASGAGVNPRIVHHYDGKKIVLHEAEGEEKEILLEPETFPDLMPHVGEDLIVTDGLTLLGADDKAGVAEILEMVKILLLHPEKKHGEICIAFTPDEEIGDGTAFFDLKTFGAKYAYTVDGGKIGELEYENFNATEAQVIFHGLSVHPGSAKNRMKNATLLAYEFHSMLPVQENPMYTEGREGFYHLEQMRGTVDQAVVHYILRDHDKQKLQKKKEMMRRVADFLNFKYGDGCVELLMEDVYSNMIEQIRPHFHLIENARKAMEQENITPIEEPIRGGTDGAMLSFKGLPCPNLFTGGYNYHGRFEYASIQEMEAAVSVLVNLVTLYADREEHDGNHVE